MSNLTRFEFYNNFDIWYDLYQENGGDPNYIINMMMYVNKNITESKYLYGRWIGNGFGNAYEFTEIYGCEYALGHGNGVEYGYANYIESGKANGYIYGDGQGYSDKIGYEDEDENIDEYEDGDEYGYGNSFQSGNGTF